MAEERKAALSDQFLKDKKVLEEKLATAEENFNIYLSGVFISIYDVSISNKTCYRLINDYQVFL